MYTASGEESRTLIRTPRLPVLSLAAFAANMERYLHALNQPHTVTSTPCQGTVVSSGTEPSKGLVASSNWCVA